MLYTALCGYSRVVCCRHLLLTTKGIEARSLDAYWHGLLTNRQLYRQSNKSKDSDIKGSTYQRLWQRCMCVTTKGCTCSRKAWLGIALLMLPAGRYSPQWRVPSPPQPHDSDTLQLPHLWQRRIQGLRVYGLGLRNSWEVHQMSSLVVGWVAVRLCGCFCSYNHPVLPLG